MKPAAPVYEDSPAARNLAAFMEDAPLRLSEPLDESQPPVPACDVQDVPSMPTPEARKEAANVLYWRTRALAREVVAKCADIDSLILGLEYYDDPAGYAGGEESKIAKDGGNRARVVLNAVRLALRHAKDEQ